ncbi:MAG: ketopantoate reductase family protein, partial [Stellaceae bacterium]
MTCKVLILGASYGALLGTKLLMARHDVTLVCRRQTADLINSEGTEVRIKLKGEDKHRTIRSNDLPGRLTACAPQEIVASSYDLVGLAMQEPQYAHHSIRTALIRIAEERIPCLSIMNMPPLTFLKRIPGVDTSRLAVSYTDPSVWDRFDPNLMTMCSPDPQAFRPPDEPANVLQVGLPTNFRVARFSNAKATAILQQLEGDIDAVRLDGKDVPVKLRVYESVFVPLAKWSMLLTGNYRCITRGEPRSIRDAVHGDLAKSASIYAFVSELAQRLGADPADGVPFEKYAKAAESLVNPSSAARAVASGAPFIERVDVLVQLIARDLGMSNADIDETVRTVDD